MRFPATVPALTFLAGITIGWRAPALSGWPMFATSGLLWACGLSALVLGWRRVFLVATALGFVAVGILLGSEATTAATEASLHRWAATPLTVVDMGFLLTFGTTLGILIGVPRILDVVRSRVEPLRTWGARLLLPLVGLFAATLCAELALLPISAAAFSRVSIAGLVLNFVAIPLMTVAQVSGMLAVLTGWFSDVLAAPCGYVAHLAAAGIVESARLVEVVPELAQRVPPPGPILTVGYYTGWVLALSRARRRLIRVAGIGLVVGGGAAVVLGPGRAGGRVPICRGQAPGLRVLFLDVDQADATLVQFPTGHSMLVDAAGAVQGTSAVGERVVAPALWHAGVRRLDYLALTHGDPDHIGGAEAVVRDFKPREIWEGVPVPRSDRLRRLRTMASEHGIVWRVLQAGDTLHVGDVEIIVWYPPPPDWERQRVRNDDSLVLEIRHHDVSIVLPGDIGAEVESTVTRKLRPAPVRVLKVPHHGSRTSSSPPFIETLSPMLAIVSAGRNNRFGHPHAEVVQRYEDAGAVVLQTGEVGAVEVCSDGRRVQVETQEGRSRVMRDYNRF